MEERRRKLSSKGNKFVPLLTKVCRRLERGHAVHPVQGKAQPVRC